MGEDRRIILIGLAIMAVLTFCAGIMVYSVMQRQSERFLNKGLGVALQVRVDHLVDAIKNGIDKSAAIATRPYLIEEMQKFDQGAANSTVREAFLKAAKSGLPNGFKAIAFYGNNGALVASTGQPSSRSAITVPIYNGSIQSRKTTTRTWLLYENGLVLRVEADIVDGNKVIGLVRTEEALPTVDAMIRDAIELGRTAELAICAPLDKDMQCFQTTLTHHVFPRIARTNRGEPLPMSYALQGQTGVIAALDYRNHQVVAAYSPVDDLGLGMVMKIDNDELYEPIHSRIEFILLLLLLLLASGVVILRWQILPLLRRMVNSERQARDSHNRLLESDAHIRVLTEVSPVGIFLTDANGDCVFVNDRYCEITGLTLPEALGKGWSKAFYPEDADRVFKAWYEAVRNRLPFNVECRYLQPDGSIVWVLAQATSELDEEGEIKGYVGSIIDITERKRAEDALRQSEERYRSIVTSMSEGVMIQGVSLAPIECNVSAERILGLTRDEIMGRTLADSRWRTIHEDGSPFPNDEYPAVMTLRTGKPMSNVIMGVHRPDDSLVWISINTQPLIHPGEWRPYASVATFVDITDRRRAEEELQNSEQRYRNIVELAQEGIWQIDVNNNTVLANYKMAEILGYSHEEMQGKSLFDCMDEQGRAITENNLERRRHGIAESHEFTFVRKNGEKITVLLNAMPMFDKQGVYSGSFAMVSDISERKRWETALVQSEKNFRSLVEDANVGILLHHRGKHMFANATLLGMLEYTQEEFRHTEMKDIVHPDEYLKVSSRFSARMEGKDVPHTYETILRSKNGRDIAVELTSTKTVWEGEPAGMVLLRDISDRKQAVEEMRKLSSAVEQTADTVIITNPKGEIEYVNAAFERVTGYSRDEAIGQTPRLLKSDRQQSSFYKNLWKTIGAGEVFNDIFINRRKDGELYYEEKTISPLKDSEGRITHFVATGKDVTERTQIQERLHYMAQHDALTDLPNRILLLDRLKRGLSRARRHKRNLAVLFVDLDRFKNVNDSLGHDAGDFLLQKFSERLLGCVREDDTVARFGGDEFVVFMDDLEIVTESREMAQKILEHLKRPFMIGDQQIFISASIGISMYPEDGSDTGTLLQHADAAMYRAKELGKNTYQFYSADMSARAFERLTLESSLRHALERGEFSLFYQPQFDIASRECIGVEALLRWRHPDFGLVLPGDFMPLLEETGLIVQAGEWVLETACRQLREWHDAGWSSLRMAVNLSARQFDSTKLVSSVEKLSKLLDLGAEFLEFEITESVLMEHSRETADIFARLSSMGCRFAIDDFGTGYSSLSYLKRYPIHVLKIDQSFVRDIPGDKDDAAIVSTIVAMARNLKLQVVAEGVETEEQLEFLKNCRCDSLQGYLYSRPLPPEEVIQHFPKR